MNEVELMFKDKGISRVGTNVYSKGIAIDFVNECRKHKINILGIDALIIQEKHTEPSMDNSIDFTASQFKENKPPNIWDASVAFLIEREDKYYFEIVCSE